MAKRRLSEQQQRRISSKQQQRSRQADPAARAAEPSDARPEAPGTEVEGLVICHYGQQLEIESCAADSAGQIVRCHQRSNLPALVTGDRVIWQADTAETGVVLALKERRSVLSRPSSQREQRPVAANVDLMVIVIAPLPEPFANMIDRYLVAAESLGLKALILLNKTDLIQLPRDAAIEEMLDRYQGIGYPTLRVSSKSASGLQQLRDFLALQTAVFVGQSGVGKSSLINALRGSSEQQQEAAVGELSAARDKGTHTTTATRLYHLPDSGDLIDSPGIREFGLWHMDQQQLIRGFIEFQPYIGRCRFRDCQHQKEPGCALLQAQEQGLISRERLSSYFHTLSTLPEQSYPG